MDWSSKARRHPPRVREFALLGDQPDSRPGIRACRRRGSGAGTPGARRGADRGGFPDARAEQTRFRDAAPAVAPAGRRQAPLPGRTRDVNADKRRFPDAKRSGSENSLLSAIGRIPVPEFALLGIVCLGSGRRARGEAPIGADSRTRAPSKRDSGTPHRPPPSPGADKRRFPDAQRRPEKGRRGGGGSLQQDAEKHRRSQDQRSIGLMEIASASRLAPQTTR